MTSPAACPSFAGYRFPAEIISQAVWLYFAFEVWSDISGVTALA
ncbi:hypothetical protein [Pararoseomonas baculiformis]|nr:hypothetical protein [Pararoseomonas baculiformis]